MAQSTAIPGQFDLIAPAQRFTQGGRDVYSFILDLPEVDRLLPVRVEDRIGMAEDANRPLTLSHAKEIQEYLEKQEKWVFGTLLLGIDPAEVEFEPWQDTDRAVVAGQLRIHASSALKIFDGQHRRRAITDALESLRGDRHKRDKLSSLHEASVPIMLYAEASIDALRQMFSDASQTKTIERNAVAQFDQRDAFNRAAILLLEDSEFLDGRVEMERASVSRTTPYLIAINQLSATLKVVEVGLNGRVSKELNNEYLASNASLEELVARCLVWSDEFMPSAREEYDYLLAGEIDNSEIPQWRSSTLAFNATVIRILASCYHEWTKDDADWGPLASYIRGSSLKPGAGAGSLLVDAGAVIPGGITPVGRMAQVESTTRYIIGQAKNSGN